MQERIHQLRNNYVSKDSGVEYLACVDVRQESWNVKTYTFQAPREGFVKFVFKARPCIPQQHTHPCQSFQDLEMHIWELACLRVASCIS